MHIVRLVNIFLKSEKPIKNFPSEPSSAKVCPSSNLEDMASSMLLRIMLLSKKKDKASKASSI